MPHSSRLHRRRQGSGGPARRTSFRGDTKLAGLLERFGRSLFAATLFVVLGIGAVGALLQCPSGGGGFGSCLPGMAPAQGPGRAVAAPTALPPAATPAKPPASRASSTARTILVDALIADSFERLPAEPGAPLAASVASATTVAVAENEATGSAVTQPAAAPALQPPPPALGRQQQAAAALPHETRPADASLLAAIARLQARIREVREAAAPAAPPQVAPVPATKPATFKAAASDSSADTKVVGGQGVTVRSGPSTTSGRLFALANGQEVTVIGKKRGWLQIVDKRGRRGWAYSRYFKS